MQGQDVNDDNGRYVENARISTDGKLMNGRINKYISVDDHGRFIAVSSNDREKDLIENQIEQGYLNNRNGYDGHVYQNGKKYFWDEIENGRTTEVRGVNTGKWMQ